MFQQFQPFGLKKKTISSPILRGLLGQFANANIGMERGGEEELDFLLTCVCLFSGGTTLKRHCL